MEKTGMHNGGKWKQYPSLREEQFYIDKTESLEKGMREFPSVYIEGAAASGKTTVVQLFLQKNPQTHHVLFRMREEMQDSGHLMEQLQELRNELRKHGEEEREKRIGFSGEEHEFAVEGISKSRGAESKEPELLVIFEDMPSEISREISDEMIRLIRSLPVDCKVIMLGREKPPENLLEPLWKGEMELVSQGALRLNPDDIRKMVESANCPADAMQLFQVTGGWAGCSALLVRMLCREQQKERLKPRYTDEELRMRYEVDAYIRKEILETLSHEEQRIMEVAALCPWMNALLCQDIWGIENAENTLNNLERKGLLVRARGRNRWRMALLFRQNYKNIKPANPRQHWSKLGNWYEKHGFTREMIWCLKESGDLYAFHKAVLMHYEQIPFLEMPSEILVRFLTKQESAALGKNSPELCYLRGMFCYAQQNLKGIDGEILRLEKMLQNHTLDNPRRTAEICLNLKYVKWDLPLDDWLEVLKSYTQQYVMSTPEKEKFHLYDGFGNSFSCLCGTRNLTGLFACSRREQNYKAAIWKECLGEEDWIIYQLARLDYYIETARTDAILEEDRILISDIASDSRRRILADRQAQIWMGRLSDSLAAEDQLYKNHMYSWQIRLVGLYLLCRFQRKTQEKEREEAIFQLESGLLEEESAVCRETAEAVASLYATWRKNAGKTSRWLRNREAHGVGEITGYNFAAYFCQAKSYLIMNQFERAEKLLSKLEEYFRKNKNHRLLAEVLFEEAVVSWAKGRHSQAGRSAIESFMITGESRYVTFYTEYGKTGLEVLNAYVEWMKSNSPEGWTHKKKYNYGNVLRMPAADYLEVIQRIARRTNKNGPGFEEHHPRERLTMMETILLQDISLGLTNGEICVELNLKLPTVKSHLYSLYKKLGVSSRGKAIQKGRELGIIE